MAVLYCLEQESQTLGTGLWPVRDQALQQEVSSGQAKLRLGLQLLPLQLLSLTA